MSLERTAAGLLVALVLGATAAHGAAADDDIRLIVERVGARVAQYYSKAQSIIADETVRIQSESRDMRPEGLPQVFVYETRIEMTPASDAAGPLAAFTRHLMKVGGRAPSPRAKEPPDKCTTNQSGRPTPEPLADLLPENQHNFTFTATGREKLDGRPSLIVEYKPIKAGTPIAKWTKDCLDTNLPPDYYRTRVWVDADTTDVLRIDQTLVKMFTVEVPEDETPAVRNRWMTMTGDTESTRYQTVKFDDPEETIVLPRRSESVVVWSAVAAPRTRTTQTFTNYRRFVGESHLVEAAPGQ